jgi:hypothetical protein
LSKKEMKKLEDEEFAKLMSEVAVTDNSNANGN